ncbi:MAG: phosphoribosylanthranilate isomerase [Chitinophagia bacterium]|nr:phosphoribosylanthranilate isomerase [Chitinophagia bacterium]
MSMNIKVCGLTQLKQLQQLDALNVAFAGLIFHKDSPRYVVDKIAKDELKDADFDLKKVGVFVNADYDEIMQMIDDYGLDVVQLHGDESPELCEELSEEVEVIKAFSISDKITSIDDMIVDYDDVCDYYLFDTASKNGKVGGTGEKFDWKLVKKSKIEKPFFLSGGISLDDLELIKSFKHPDYFGVDVNSRFEKSPGIKDMALLLQLRQGIK